MRSRMVPAAVLAVALGAAGPGAAGERSPTSTPAARGSCALVASGSPADHALITALEGGFARAHPGVCITKWLHGPESTLAPVYTGTADVAFMPREVREPMERMAFEWAVLSKPFALEIAYAGYKDDRPGTQLALFVHRDNPLKGLTLAQLDGILGAEHKRGAGNIRDWGALGVRGRRSSQAIEIIGPPVDSIAALFVRRLVMKDSRKWNPDYREMAEGDAILTALADSPDAIALAPAHASHPMTRPLPLAADERQPFVLPEPAAITSRAYPLTRTMQVVTRRPEGEPIRPELSAFLHYLLSPEGQAIIARDGSYLPLDADSLDRQRARLK